MLGWQQQGDFETMKTLEVLVNPFERKEFESPDSIEKLESIADQKVDFMFNHFIKKTSKIKFPLADGQVSYSKMSALEPSQINLLLNKLLEFNPEYGRRPNLGLFISAAIDLSHDTGNNYFKLSANYPVDYLCRHLGNKKGVLVVELIGDAGSCFGSGSRNSIFSIHGDAKSELGNNTESCIFAVEGDVGDMCGDASRGSIFIIKGKAGESLGFYSKYSIYLAGDVAIRCGELTEESTFATKNSQTYEKIQIYFNPSDKNLYKYHTNKVIMLK